MTSNTMPMRNIICTEVLPRNSASRPMLTDEVKIGSLNTFRISDHVSKMMKESLMMEMNVGTNERLVK